MTKRFFIVGIALVLLFIAGYFFRPIMWITAVLCLVFAAVTIFDLLRLGSSKNYINVKRIPPKILSLGNENRVSLLLEINANLPINVEIIDELPHQIQKRDFLIEVSSEKKEDYTDKINYTIRPTSRGLYSFGKVHCFLSSSLHLVQFRRSFDQEAVVNCYPSLIDMKEYQLIIEGRQNALRGIRKIRKIGQSTEFDQIKDYISGDDFNKINWKSTSRLNKLMVNHFTDEKSQLIYSFIDKSKSMNMPFNGLSLLDYSINTSLMISNTALLKKDNVGLISFCDKIETKIPASSKNGQLKRILEQLHKEEEREVEPDFDNLYQFSKQILKKRSLIFLFTNFESKYALDRALPVLRMLNKKHLLIPIIFKNEELENFHSNMEIKTIKDIYTSTITQKYAQEKTLIVQALNSYGIQTIYTTPKKLSVNVLNKYLELKARGMI